MKDRLTDEQLRQLCRETKEAQNPLGQMAGKLAAELLTARAEIVAARDAARAAQDANGEAGNTITQLQAEKHELQDDYIALTAERDKLREENTRQYHTLLDARQEQTATQNHLYKTIAELTALKAERDGLVMKLRASLSKNKAATATIKELKGALSKAAKMLADAGHCTHYPGYTCDKDFPAACPECISKWLRKLAREPTP